MTNSLGIMDIFAPVSKVLIYLLPCQWSRGSYTHLLLQAHHSRQQLWTTFSRLYPLGCLVSPVWACIGLPTHKATPRLGFRPGGFITFYHPSLQAWGYLPYPPCSLAGCPRSKLLVYKISTLRRGVRSSPAQCRVWFPSHFPKKSFLAK